MSTDERRRAILECAARLFRHYGHGKTTVADIAREAQMGVGTFYLVFPSKEAIVEELSSSAHDRVLEAMRQVAETRAFDSFAERLTGVLEERLTRFLELAAQGQHACELVHCKSDPVKSAHARFADEEAALLRQVFDDARARGELEPIDVERAVRLVQRAYVTLSPPWLFELAVDEARLAAYEMARLLLQGLAARAPGGSTTTSASASASAKLEPKPSRPRRAR